MLCFQPAAKLGQGGHVHLLQLVQQYKTAVRVQAADDGGSHPQLIAAGHVPPVLSFISKGTVLHAQLRQGQVSTVQQGHTVGPLLSDGFGELVVVAGILGGFVLSPGFFQVGPHLAVGLLNVPDGGFQLGGGFVLQICGRGLGDFYVGLHRGQPLLFRAQLKFKVCNHFFLPFKQICELN